jgi:hypothetical protein
MVYRPYIYPFEVHWLLYIYPTALIVRSSELALGVYL